MSRREKLMRLAAVVRAQTNGVYIFHRLEHMTEEMLKSCTHPYSAFQLALGDASLRKAGLKPDHGGLVSAHAAEQFFELSKGELHEFSCDCGGAISNERMAQRIEKIAGPKAAVVESSSWAGRLTNTVRGASR